MNIDEVKKKYLFKWSHFAATILGSRAPWTTIKEKANNTGKIYLGSMLFNKGVGRYSRHTLSSLRSSSLGTKKLHVVRVVEPFELQHHANPIVPSTRGSRAISQDDINNGTLSGDTKLHGPFAWKDFGYSNSLTPEEITTLSTTMRELYDVHNNNEAIYFHCKAGVNRSFRMTALFLTYCKIQDNFNQSSDIISEVKLEDWIMEHCAMIWDKRPCVCFNRHEWLSQLEAIKSMLMSLCPMQIDKTKNHNSELKQLRLNCQYEMYSYRHKLKKEKKEALTKIEVVDEIIESTKIKQPNDTLENSQKRCKNVVENKMAILKQERSHGIVYLLTALWRFIRFQNPLKNHARRVISRLWKPEPAPVSASEKVGISFQV